MSDVSEIRRLARRLLDGDKGAWEPLAWKLLPTVDAGLEAALRGATTLEDPEALRDGVLGKFLDDKLQSEGFWTKLVEGDSPLGLVRVTAYRLALTDPKKLPSVSRLSSDSVGVDGLEDGSLDAEASLVRLEALATELGAIEELPLEDRALLYVLHAEHIEPPTRELEWIADQRGESVESVRADLETRSAVQGRGRAKLQAQVDKKLSLLQKLHAEVDRCWASIRGKDPERAKPATLEPTRREELRRSSSALDRASPQERSGLLSYLETRREAVAKELGAAKKKLSRTFGTGPRYEEVALILGLAEAEDVEALRRAANTVNQRSRRLESRLRAARSAGGSHG